MCADPSLPVERPRCGTRYSKQYEPVITGIDAVFSSPRTEKCIMRRFLIIFVASLVLFMLGSIAPVAAQSGDQLLVLTFICETYHDAIGGGFGVMPEDCHYQGDITIRVTDQSGTVVAECTSSEGDHAGYCSIQVPLGTTITVTEDLSTVPEGYAPTKNPIVVDTPPPPGATGEWIKEFINIPAGVTLPNTGSGGAVGADQHRGPRSFAIMALLLGAAAFALRRQSSLRRAESI
jgi:hypothetical protein